MYTASVLICLFAVSTVQSLTLSELKGKFDSLEQEVNTLKQKESNSEAKIIEMQNQLEYGGKKYTTLPYGNASPLKDHDYLMLQSLGSRTGFLGCAGGTCGVATCPSYNNNYRFFDGRCYGEEFQIIGEGTIHDPIKSGQRIRLHYLLQQNTWVKYLETEQCGKGTCSGTTAQATDFNNYRCHDEMFRIYARGKKDGDVVYSKDIIMLYSDHGRKYLSLQGEHNGDPSKFNYCPGKTPPAYLSYGICSKNVFRINRKP